MASVVCGDVARAPGGARRRPSLRWTAVLVVAVGALVGLSLWGAASSEPDLLPLDVAAAVGAVGLTALVRQRPVPVTIALAVLAGLSPVATPAAAVGIIFTAIESRFLVATAVTAVVAATHIARGVWRPIEGLPFGWLVTLVLIGAAANLGWGTLGKANNALIRSFAERAERAEAEQGRRVAEARAAERTRLAREMHDVLAHRLSLLATYAGALEFRPDAPAEKRERAAAVIRQGVHEALDELRTVVALLRVENDAYENMQPVLADVPRLVSEARGAGTTVSLEDAVSELDCPPAIGRTAYRVVQESLTNARKHADGLPVSVSLAGAPGEQLMIAVRNPLSGKAIDDPVEAVGHGLVGLTERVRLVGGRLDHRRTADEFEVRASLPWPNVSA